MRNLG